VSKPTLSICITSNRPQFWMRLYESIIPSLVMEIELIFSGPVKPDYNLPGNVVYIETKNIKPPQCVQVAINAAQGEFISLIADDCIVVGNIDNLFSEYNKICDKEGCDNIIVSPQFRYRGKDDSTPYARHMTGAPTTSLVLAFFKTQLMKDTGGIDKNFLGVYWDIDWIMRFYELGGKVFKISSVAANELAEGISGRLYKTTKHRDREILDSFWVRKINDQEIVPSDTAWCFYGNKDTVLSKYRLKKFEPFVDNDITEYSQGIKSYGTASWV